MTEKVYCFDSGCKHFFHGEREDGNEQCQHPKNVYYKDTPIKEVQKFRHTPQQINIKNDCNWFNMDE